MTFTIAQIAKALDAPCVGNQNLKVTSLAEPHLASAEQLALAFAHDFLSSLKQSATRAAILPQNTDWQALGLEAAIFVNTGRAAMPKITQLFDPRLHIKPNIHPAAVIDPSAKIGPGATIDPLVSIAKGVKIGKNAKIFAQASIGENTIIGDNALISSGVRIEARVKIGNDFIAQPGVVIGSDGFSFENERHFILDEVQKSFDQPGFTPKGKIGNWQRIHSLGGVFIGDNVEIGANTAIDRGTIRDTYIGAHTKIDNLVHIAHNVSIGRYCLICGQVGIAGTAKLGDRVFLAGQCGVGDNISVGENTIAGFATKIFSNVKPGKILLGNPATDMYKNIQKIKMVRRLPRLFAKLKILEQKIEKDK